MLIIAKPFWGLVFFVALLYSRPEESIRALAGMHLTMVISLTTLAGMIFKLLLDRAALVRTPFIGMMVGLYAAIVWSAIFGGKMGEALNDGGRLVMLIVLILNLCRTPNSYRALVTSLIVFSCYLAIYSVFMYSTGTVTMDQGLARSRGTGIFSDPNDLAATMTAGLALAFSRVLDRQGISRLVYCLLAGTMVWAIVLTNSRSGLLALIVMCTGYLIVFSKNRAKAVVLAALLAASLLAVAPERMRNFDSREESANSRKGFWQEGLTQLKHNPFTGIGYLKFAEVNGGFVAHNSFVHCFAELGLPGFFFWMGGIYYAFKKPQNEVESASADGKEGVEPAASNENTVVQSVAAASVSDARDLLGSRLAIIGYLTACFFITRTYTPVMYVLFCLPLAQQISQRKSHIFDSGTLAQRFRQWCAIGGLCLGMIVIIQLLVLKSW